MWGKKIIEDDFLFFRCVVVKVGGLVIDIGVLGEGLEMLSLRGIFKGSCLGGVWIYGFGLGGFR